MKLKKVKFKNFKSAPDNEISLDLNFQGSKLITGANGSGKTTFFDAIIWALYGKTPMSADDVINRKTGKNCKVEVEFSIGSTNYSVIRYRKHEEKGNAILIFKNKKNISPKNASDAQQLILDIIQISYTAMTSSVVLSSELYSPFLRSRESKRLEILENILSLKDINEYSKILKKIRKPITEGLQTTSDKLIEFRSSLNTLIKMRDEYKENVKNELLKLKEEKRKKEERLEELKERIEKANSINVDNHIKEAEEEKKKKEENDKIDKNIEELKNRLKTDIDEKIEEIKKLEAELKSLKNIEINKELNHIKEYEKYNEETKSLKSKLSELGQKIVSFSTEENNIKKLNIEKENIQKTIDDLNHQNICPTCNQEIDKQLVEKLLNENNEKKENIIKEIEEKTFIIDKAKKDNEVFENEIIKLEKEINELEEIDVPKYEASYLYEIDKNKSILKEKIISLNAEIKQRDEYNNEINIQIQEEEKKKKELIGVKYSYDYLIQLKDEINLTENNFNVVKNEIEKIKEKALTLVDKKFLENQEKEIKRTEKNIVKVEEKLKELKHEDAHHEVLSKLFSNKESGFKKFFINKMIKVFNERVNKYLPHFFDENVQISFNKGLTETIKVDGVEVSFNSFSSGQKTRLELAITFTLFLMNKLYFASSCNLLVLDEILDSNLDEKGFKSVLSLIEGLSQNNAIFVISHQEFYKENFNHHIKLKLVDGYTKIIKEV